MMKYSVLCFSVVLVFVLTLCPPAEGDLGEDILFGDIGGDGTPDLVLGDPDSGDGGAVLILLDPVVGNLTSSDADIVITGENGSMFGTGVAMADLNDDNLTDIIVGAPNSTNGTGVVYVFLGPISNCSYLDANVTIDPPAGNLGFGANIEPCDVTLDGVTDLAVSSIHRPGGNGLVGSYFDKTDQTDRKRVSVDPGIAFDWGLSAPAGLNANTFSVKWTGILFCNETGSYTFWADVNDGVRVWLDGNMVIDEWSNGDTNASGTVHLLEGYHDLRVEYYESIDDAYAYLNWTTPYGSGPIPAENLSPSLSSPVSIVKGKTDVSNLKVSGILMEDVEGNAFGSALVNTSSGLSIGSWSVGRAYLYDVDQTSPIDYYTVKPDSKGSGDNTGGDINDLKADDNDYYEVGRDSDEDDFEIETFDISSINADAIAYGEIISITLRIGYYTDDGYSGNNYMTFEVEGESETDCIQPLELTTETHVTFDLLSNGVDSVDDIEDLDIRFNNDDGGWWGDDSVFYDYILIEVGIEMPILQDYVQGPPSFGASIASNADTFYVGAPSVGPYDNHLGTSGMAGGGGVYSFDLAALPMAALEADDMMFGLPYSSFGTSLAESNGTLGIGAPNAFLGAQTGAVVLASGMTLSGSGLSPYTHGSAGTSVAMSGSLLAAGNPDTGTVHLINITAAPTIDVSGKDIVFVPSDEVFSVDIVSSGLLNVTSYTIPQWAPTLNGSGWTRAGAGSIELDLNIPAKIDTDAPIAVVGRSVDGLTCGLDIHWVRTLEVGYNVEDLYIQRADGEAFASPDGGVEGEASTVLPFIHYLGPGSAGTNVTISTNGTYLNRTVPMPADLLSMGDDLSMVPYAVDVWRASDQAGSSVTTTGLGNSHYSWRTIIDGSYLHQRTGRIRLTFYTPVDLLFDQVFIAVTGTDDRDVVDGSWAEVLFGAVGYYNATAGETLRSDWIDIGLEPGLNYSVSFHTQTRGTNSVTYQHGNSVFGTYRRDGDYRSDRDWSDDALNIFTQTAYLRSIEGQEHPVEIRVTSLPYHSDDGWTAISWSSTVPDGTEVAVAIRTADDPGGQPVNWTAWHGPPGESRYTTPTTIAEAGPWIQYTVHMISIGGVDTPVLHSFTLSAPSGIRARDTWSGPRGPGWGPGDLMDYETVYPARSLWKAPPGHQNITIETGGDADTFLVEMASGIPATDVHVLGRVVDGQGTPTSGVSITVYSTRTGGDIGTTSDGSGDYSLNLSTLSGGWVEGDRFDLNFSYMGAFSTNSFLMYSRDGDRWWNQTLLVDGLEVYIELQDTPFGPAYIRMYRESDGNETDLPVQGEDTLLRARVGNRGEVTAKDVMVAFFDNGSMIGTAQMIGLVPWEVQEIEQWWTPDPGWTNLSIMAWGMWNHEHFLWADLWDAPTDWGEPVDFTSETYNTPEDLNTFGVDGGDPMLSFDGWDWENGAYGATDLTMTEFGDPTNDADYTSSKRIEVRIADGSGALTGQASGAWGTQFYIDPTTYSERSEGSVFLNLTFTFDNFDNDLEEDAAIVGRLRNDGRTLWLGEDTNPFDTPNSSIFTKLNASHEVFNSTFSQEVSSFFNVSGHYYLDLGVILEEPASGPEGVGAYFDDISLEFMKNVYDQHPANDGYWTNVSILPLAPTTPFNATVHFFDNYNLTGLRVNFTAMVDGGTLWMVDDQANGTGHYDIDIPPGNYTEASILAIDVDDVRHGVRYRGGFERVFYSYESPMDIDIPLFSYGYNMTSLVDYGETVPNGSLDYSFEVSSDSNVGIDVNLNVTGLPDDWEVTLTGTDVNTSGLQYTVHIDAYSSVVVTARLDIPANPLAALPGNYSWQVEGGAWFSNDSVSMRTHIIPDLTFEIEGVDLQVIGPNETLLYNITVTSTGNVDNRLDFNISAHPDWNVTIPNATMSLAPAATGNLLFYLTAPEWPDENMTAGTDHSFLLYGSSRYASEYDDINIDLRIGELHDLWLNGSDMECDPGVKVYYPLIVTNDGNLRETVNLSLEWDTSLGNVSGPDPFDLGYGKRRIVAVEFTPSADLNVSLAGNIVLVNASVNGSNWTVRFTIRRIDIIDLPSPDLVETVIGQETGITVLVESRGNGPANFTLEVENGIPDHPYLELVPWEPRTIGIRTTPDSEGWSNVTITIMDGSDVIARTVVPVKVARGYVDLIMGDPELLVEDVQAFDVSPNTGDIAYISSGRTYFLPAGGAPIDLGQTNATHISITELEDTYIALGGPRVVVHAVSNSSGSYEITETWNDFGNGTQVVMDTSEFAPDRSAVYLLWIAPSGVMFRSYDDFSDDEWNPSVNLWSGAARSIDMLADGNEINLAWGGNGVHFGTVAYSGSFDIPASRIVNVPPPTSVSLFFAGDLHLGWSSSKTVSYSVYNGSWSVPESVRLGTEVSGVQAWNVTTFAVADEYISISHLPEGFWQASMRSNVSSPTLIWDGILKIYYLDDGLWLNEVGSPMLLDWNGSAVMNFTLDNWGTVAESGDPEITTGDGWHAEMDGVSVPAGGSNSTVLAVYAPASILSDPATLVSISFNDVELALVPAMVQDAVIHELIIDGAINATPEKMTNATLTIRNTGNSPEDVLIDIVVPDNWTIEIETPSLRVRPGGTNSTNLTIMAPADTLEADLRITLTYAGRSTVIMAPVAVEQLPPVIGQVNHPSVVDSLVSVYMNMTVIRLVSLTWSIPGGPALTGMHVNGTFTVPGENIVRVTATNPAGNDTISFTVTVLNREPVGLNFSADGIKAGKRTSLSGTGTDPEGFPLTFSWVIRGKEINGSIINYTFRKKGTYQVTLRAEDPHGGSVSITKNVVVAEKDKEDAAGINPLLLLAISLIAFAIVVILLYVRNKKEPVRPKTPVDDTAFKNVNAKWPQTMQTVRDLDPKTARIFARAKVLKFDPVTNILKLGLSEEAKKAVTPEALKVMEKGFHKVHRSKVFLFIESGPQEMTDEEDDDLTLTPMAKVSHRGPKVKKDGPDDELSPTTTRSAFQPRTREKRYPPGGAPRESGKDKGSRAQRPGPRTEKKPDRGPEDGATRRPLARPPRSREGRPAGPRGGRTGKKVVKRPKTGSPKKEN